MGAIMLPGGSTGKSFTAQAPIRGLQRAFQQQAPSMAPEDEQEGPAANTLGTRLPQEPFQALMDVVRRFGKVY